MELILGMDFTKALRKATRAGRNMRRHAWPPSQILLVSVCQTYSIGHHDLLAEDWVLT